MLIQTTLTLFGASAAIASALIFVCRPVLTGALDAMRNSELPIVRMLVIGVWAFAVVATIIWVVSTAAVTMHSRGELKPPTQEQDAALQSALGAGVNASIQASDK